MTVPFSSPLITLLQKDGAAPAVAENILTEAGAFFITEAGDNFITEQS